MQELLGFAQKYGFLLPEISLDGTLKRFGRGGSKKNAWFIGWQGAGDSIAAVMGDWKTGEKYEYKNKSSKIVKDFFRDAVIKATKDREERAARAAENAVKLFNSASTTATETPYTKKKNISNLYGARTQIEDTGRAVYVAMTDGNNNIVGLQKIFADGSKRFLSGQNNVGAFCRIGGDPTDKLYICEGWATGIAVYEATKVPVYCAFSGGNLKNVATTLRQQYKNVRIIIAGDNDEAGRKYAGEAGGDEVVFPEAEGADFADEPIEIKIEEAEKPTGFVPLGFAQNNSTYYFFKRETSSVVEIRHFNDNDFLKLKPSAYWDAAFPGAKGGFDRREATDYLIKISEAMGVYDPTRQRGIGAWIDAKKYVVNTGRKVYGIDPLKSRFVYTTAATTLADRPTKTLSDAESVLLIDACEAFRWRDDNMGKLLAGWLALARVAACLPKRYHVWITGSSDTGKTEIMENVVRYVLGEDGHAYFKGSTTEAGLRQTINNSTRPVVFDEFESDGGASNERIAAIIQLLRIAFDAGKVTKGSTGGSAQDFIAAFPAIVSSIRVALDNDADRSRFLQVELQPLLTNQTARAEHYAGLLKAVGRIHEINDFSERLFWRSFNNLENIIHNIKELRRAFSSRCDKSRTVHMYAILAAGHYSLVTTGRITDSAIRDYAAGLDFGEEPVPDEELCLQHIMSMKIQIIDARQKGMSEQLVYDRPSVAELINKAADGKQLTHDEELALERDGFKIYKDSLCISRNSPIIKTHCSKTKWANSFGSVLTRVGEASRSRFHGTRIYTVSISLDKFKS